MAKAQLVIHLVPGTPRLHLWCDTCLTSARYEIDVLHLTTDGPRPITTIKRCRRCTDDGDD